MLGEVENIKDILDRTIKSLGISKRLKETDAVALFAEVVGEKVSHNAVAESINGGKLLVRVLSPVWRQELNYQKDKIIKAMNNSLGETVVSDIYFAG